MSLWFAIRPLTHKNHGVDAMSSALRLGARFLLLLGGTLATLLPLTSAAQPAGAIDYSRLPARSSPAWVHDGVVYEIFPRQFSVSGDFNGVTAQLDRLQPLGVTILSLMPVHPVGKLN